MELMQTAFLIDSLSIYKNLRKDPVISGIYDCVTQLYTNSNTIEQLSAVNAYSNLCRTLYESETPGNLADYIFNLVLYDVNVFSLACANGRYDQLDFTIRTAAESDLRTLCVLSTVSDSQLKGAFKSKFVNSGSLVDGLPGYTISHKRYPAKGEWGSNIDSIAHFYRENGVGMFARYHGFIFEQDIQPVKHPDPIKLSDLKQYEIQRQKIIDNTLGLLEGHPCNNVLLYGDRGTGKSSTVKALLDEFGDRGLRIVELNKKALVNLDQLLLQLQGIPLKFIVFIDDLTFNENDETFNILKAALEGSLGGRPKNVVIYATSNRRHLIKESFSAREGSELHRADTIDENMSLSDRFGLTVTFLKPDKSGFLEIVRQLAEDRGLDVPVDTLEAGAERFALAKGGRSPRLAKQYIDHLEARRKLNLPVNA